ncbi:alpha/beta hydrolase [Hydrogenophaga sp. YM1]|uniref:alpha/beta fold hydrolase n=1 Tax=unclassified Hydrogenophaga TaxID=2610897 RepID=UPI000878A5E0|nr:MULTISPECIES: alpha/beta hydrolase [unclassified Hydrogenophaga]MBN9371576.1 alpha/beta hydrolase [Hydrogenophaga sp.]OJV40745.1 MAG: alpha/beta hydrolase [Hydrogenophaga sp. 70-12]QRR32764.1 alpha/beta hydrolase [Hydrogenophaga sp. YM1]
MTEPQLQHTVVGGAAAREGGPRCMAWWDWRSTGGRDDHVVVCVHGLSRQGRDFDTLARALQPFCRVVAVDVAGRGHSDWLADPMAYQVPTYVADLAVLLQQLRAQRPGVRIDWVGTSMGGLIGMGVAAQPLLAPTRLVLNDVGPVVQWEALMRIGTYLGLDPDFDSMQAASDYLASISKGFGPHTPEQWRALSLPMLRERGGRVRLHYDPAIALPFKAMTQGVETQALREAVRAGEAALWDLYDAIAAPTLVLRGEDSDLLSMDTVRAMQARGPRPRCVSFAGVGHAPTLMADDQVRAVLDFLLSP